MVMSTGLVLLMGCAMAGTLLLRRQLRHGMTGFGLLATSDSVISAIIGVIFVALGLLRDDAGDKFLCSRSMMLASASVFLLPFVNSFISMLLMSIQCWFDAKAGTELNRSHRFLNNKKKQMVFATVAQWLLPVLSIMILNHLTPNGSTIHLSKLQSSNSTCESKEMFPLQMTNGCQDEIFEEGNQQINNLTLSVVQRVYQLINGSATDPKESINYYLPSQPQANEEWKNIFMQLKIKETGQEDMRNRKVNYVRKSRATLCDENCASSFKRVQGYLTGLILTIYTVPMLATLFFHHSTKTAQRHREGKNNLQEAQESNTPAVVENKVCHLREIKMMALSNFIMWTPSLVERFVKEWLCNSAPEWLVALLFVIGQMSNVIRGAINANTANSESPLHKNIILPLNPIAEASAQSVQASNKTEILFHKRME